MEPPRPRGVPWGPQLVSELQYRGDGHLLGNGCSRRSDAGVRGGKREKLYRLDRHAVAIRALP